MKDEIRMLQNIVGEFISLNAFFSRLLDHEVALFYLGDPSFSIDLERAFFQINADLQLDNIKSFGNITVLSHFAEEEVLFMIGSIFDLFRWNVTIKESGIFEWCYDQRMIINYNHSFNI
jgi:hypothetical protein